MYGQKINKICWHAMLCVVLLVFAISANAHTYVEHSCLATKKFVKVRVGETGVCKISTSQLKDMGLTPEKVAVFGYGGALMEKDFAKAKIDDLPQVPVYKSTDGSFGKDDYILFYAQGPIAWKYDGLNFIHTQNHYSSYGYYFLTDEVDEVKTLVTTEAATFSTNAYEVTTYSNCQVHDIDNINLLDIEGGGEGGGKDFYYDKPLSSASAPLQLSFSFADHVATNMRAVLNVASTSTALASFVVSNAMSSNTVRVSAKSTSDKYEMAATSNTAFSLYPTDGDEQIVSIQYKTSSLTAAGYLNFLELVATCNLRMSGNALVIRNTEHVGSSVNSVYRLENASANVQIWDVTDLSDIHSVPTRQEGSRLSFELDNEVARTIVAVNTKAQGFVACSMVGKIDNQDLHSLRDVEYVIIAPDFLVGEAERLAKAHEERDGLTWAVLTDQQVYNEYSSGTPDATAYRWIMKQLYDRARREDGVLPKYLLLFGDGSYDNRHIVAASAPNTLLTYQADNSTHEVKAYSTDDYFGFLDDHEGISDIVARMDIGVGRLPLNTQAEATEVVDKIIRYMSNTTKSNWKSQLCFLADDGDGGLHTTIGDYAAENIRVNRPDYIVNKIYLDSYQQEMSASGETYPVAKLELDKLLQSGVLFFDYSGHGGYNNITSECVLTANEIRNMHNENMGVWMLATCGFACYDAKRTSASEYAVLNPYGGAVAVISACRTVYAANNKKINRFFCDSLFTKNNEDMTIGEALRLAKNLTGSEENKLAYIMLGDPALRLNYPDQYKVLTTEVNDTIGALSTPHIKGIVANKQNERLTTFNGKVQLTVFDKLQVLTTLDNDQTDEDEKKFVEFNDYPNVIFNGEVDVKNGEFEIDFMVPIDIRYNFGKGKLSYYAYSDDAEAIGYYDEIVIGGSSKQTISDTVGPEMNIYINTPYFVDGSTISSSAYFYAELNDSNGINTSGSGIGHDLTLIIDNDPKQTYVLNQNFRTVPNSYREGMVTYHITGLTKGKHELMFRAWDLLNNSTTKTLRFVVDETASMAVYSMRAYPNPLSATDVLTIEVEHDRPDAVLTTNVYIYDMSGRLVATEANTAIGDANIKINLIDKKIMPGLYIYQTEVSTSEKEQKIIKTGKLIITQ